MQIKLDKEDVQLIAQAIVEKLHPKGADPEQSSPINDLDNWIRAEQLYKKGEFSASTLNRYYNKGLIGKSTIGGMVFYKISDIQQLLESHYVKKEVAAAIADNLRNRKA